MPPLIHLKLNNIIDLSCLISPSLVTDNVGFNRIKYEYDLCRWQIDYEMKSKSVPCVMRELSWQNSCIRVPQSENILANYMESSWINIIFLNALLFLTVKKFVFLLTNYRHDVAEGGSILAYVWYIPQLFFI